VPKDLNEKGVVCIMGSKLAVINNKQFQNIPNPHEKSNDEYFSKYIVHKIGKLSSFKLNQNKLCTIKEQSRLLAIIEICCKWHFESSIRDLPGQI